MTAAIPRGQPAVTTNLSIRCPMCEDSVSMPPQGAFVLVASDRKSFLGGLRRIPEDVDVYVLLHTCPNRDCIGAVVGYYLHRDGRMEIWGHQPEHSQYVASAEIPERARTLLQAANDAANAPAACASVAVKAVEAMIAALGYADRKVGLRARIRAAVDAHKLPALMADWANHVREIGNDTHTDENPGPLPTKEDASEALNFANTLAEYLFVLPARIPKEHKLPPLPPPKA